MNPPRQFIPDSEIAMIRSAAEWMRLALRLARRGCGKTSPNPAVGALLVKRGKIIGRGYTAPAGGPHAEVQALRDARRRGHSPAGATLYVTLEPCCTHGRTPPCTDAIIAAGIRRVVAGAADPNPKHSGKGFRLLRRAGLEVVHGVLHDDCSRLSDAFNHWIVHRTPFVTVKAAMTLDGKIATATGESKWITGKQARAHGQKLRQGSDAILVGVNTVLADDPSLTVRRPGARPVRRIILDALARTPPNAKVVTDEQASRTTIVVSRQAPRHRVNALARLARVLVSPVKKSRARTSAIQLNLRWLLAKLGSENVTSLLVEGGGEVNASFLLGGLTHRVAFFYAPKILGGRDARRSVAGEGVDRLMDILTLRELEWRRFGPDLFLTALVVNGAK